MSGPLADRVVALAGAAGALGPHVARALADAGATVALADVAEERVTALADALALPPARVDAAAVDLLADGGAERWAARLRDRFGRVDGLVHAVGGWRGGAASATAPASHWSELEPLLIRTVQHATRAFHAALAASPHGRFVLMSAKQARRPTGTNAAYAAAKAAAEAWTFALAEDFASRGAAATANVVAINALVTPQMRAQQPEKDFAAYTDADEVAAAIVFLLSDAARKVNGQRLALYAES